jgi:DNA-binding transcriptional LysR family regulator
LRYFVAVSDELHFGRAAAKLHVTQPALSQQIQQLEQVVTVRLLDRASHRVRLTEAGEVFAKQARRVLREADRALELTRRAAADKDPLRVAYTPSADWYFLPRLIENLSCWESSREIVWLSVDEEIGNEDILSGHFDLAVMRQFERADGVEHEVMMWERPAVYASRDDPLAAHSEIPLSALVGYRVLTPFPEFAPLRHAALLDDLAAANVDLDLDPTGSLGGLATTLAAREIASGVSVRLGFATAVPHTGITVIPLSAEARPQPLTLAWRSEDDRPEILGLVELARHVADNCTFPKHLWRDTSRNASAHSAAGP